MDIQVLKERRRRLFQGMQEGLAVLFAAPHHIRNNDTHYTYRTDSSFYYLTGFAEPEAMAIFFKTKDKNTFILFVPPKNELAELWEGKRLGVEGAKVSLAADEVYANSEFDKIFSDHLKRTNTLYYAFGAYSEHDDRIFRFVKELKANPRRGEKVLNSIEQLGALLGELRMLKDASEIALMRKNAENSALAHKQAMAVTRPGLYEYQIEAVIEKAFHDGGAEDLAYASIVAGGKNAITLHYKLNRDRLEDGELLLIDAGGEMGLYASDITRTFPISGKFAPAQKTIYELVLRANKEVIAMVKPGIRFADMHEKAVEILADGLLDLGFLKGNRADILREQKYKIFYPHQTGHWLGLDVHDVGAYYAEDGKSRTLEPGFVFTVEPGIYIPENCLDVPQEFRGIGVRIEDDIVVTSSGYEVLTKNCPKEVAELEALVGSS